MVERLIMVGKDGYVGGGAGTVGPLCVQQVPLTTMHTLRTVLIQLFLSYFSPCPRRLVWWSVSQGYWLYVQQLLWTGVPGFCEHLIQIMHGPFYRAFFPMPGCVCFLLRNCEPASVHM